MNIYFHIIIGLLATFFFAWQYKHTKYVYQLLFAIWVPSTFLTYVSQNKYFQIGLGIFQLLIFFLVLFFMFKAKRQENKKPSGKKFYTDDEKPQDEDKN